jgi:hypothetical protein
VRNPQKMIEVKKKRMIAKLRESGKKKGSGPAGETFKDKFTGGKQVTGKSRDKIIHRSAPTRSKAIMTKSSGSKAIKKGNKGGKRLR